MVEDASEAKLAAAAGKLLTQRHTPISLFLRRFLCPRVTIPAGVFIPSYKSVSLDHILRPVQLSSYTNFS